MTITTPNPEDLKGIGEEMRAGTTVDPGFFKGLGHALQSSCGPGCAIPPHHSGMDWGTVYGLAHLAHQSGLVGIVVFAVCFLGLLRLVGDWLRNNERRHRELVDAIKESRT